MKEFAQLIDSLLLSRFERDKQQIWMDYIQNNSEIESYVAMRSRSGLFRIEGI
jgi:hypothetical protein